MMSATRTLFCAFVMVLAAIAPAFAQISQFTSVELDKACTFTLIKGDNGPDAGQWNCKGIAGIEVRIIEGDLRFYIGYGPNAVNQIAMGQTVPHFNTIHSTMEWRGRMDGARFAPYATVIRYFTDNGMGEANSKGQVLVVTKLEGAEACHIAYVDARANKDANALATKAADDLAETFDCAKDEAHIIGKGGIFR